MTYYRICNPIYADDLEGTGAKLYGSRWNSAGKPMLYLAEYISLAALELLVHLQRGDKSNEFALLSILVPETEIAAISFSKLKNNWREDIGYTQFIGNEFIRNKQSLLMKVPSAIVPEEHNLLVNPLHPDAKKIKIIRSKTFRFDNRLFSL